MAARPSLQVPKLKSDGPMVVLCPAYPVMAAVLHPVLFIYLPSSPLLNSNDPMSNTGTFKIEYMPLYTQLSLNQVHANVISGFVPSTKLPNPNFSKCTLCSTIEHSNVESLSTLNQLQSYAIMAWGGAQMLQGNHILWRGWAQQ
ncbi:hypothetical protein EI94DRAFT_1698239 [Lactarius quietus]|nr:hypothetical protein EI94DRAFT_1698239 [Lactarius quietus]